MLVLAVEHHVAGRLDAAEALYRPLLDLAPQHPAALANMAMLCQQRRKPVEAAAFYERALAVGRTPELLSNLAGEFFQRTLGGSLRPFMAYLARAQDLNEEELAELKALVKELDARREEERHDE